MVKKPYNNKINEILDYSMTNYTEENSTFLPSIWTSTSSFRRLHM